MLSLSGNNFWSLIHFSKPQLFNNAGYVTNFNILTFINVRCLISVMFQKASLKDCFTQIGNLSFFAISKYIYNFKKAMRLCSRYFLHQIFKNFELWLYMYGTRIYFCKNEPFSEISSFWIGQKFVTENKF